MSQLFRFLDIYFFQLRTPAKYYIALVWGELEHENIDIRVAIGPETQGEWAGVRCAGF